MKPFKEFGLEIKRLGDSIARNANPAIGFAIAGNREVSLELIDQAIKHCKVCLQILTKTKTEIQQLPENSNTNPIPDEF